MNKLLYHAAYIFWRRSALRYDDARVRDATRSKTTTTTMLRAIARREVRVTTTMTTTCMHVRV